MASWTVESPQRITVDEPITRFDAELVSGRLNVVGADGPARVDVTRVSNRPLLVEVRDGRLTIRHKRKPGLFGFFSWFGNRIRAEVSVAVPPDVLANLSVVSGALVASGLRRETRVDVTSGQVTLRGLRGRTSAKVISGPVEALGIAGDLDLETVSGELILADSAPERVRAHAVSGSITCDLDNPRGSEIRLSAISGSITVRVREDSDLTVHLHTTSGKITSGFPQVDGGGRGLGSIKDSHGVLGGGAGRLWASATSGSIALLARPVAPADHVEDVP
ncbi:DUF4097 family beta strand repeat-containing protein [Micromonospora sp. NPDC048887]|uniref:DUF4097 family beta strand repeat-containing protein n=1 Tax=unclassified Micromonospora TaxID=2617518 RepID=UPI0033EF3085